MKKLIVLLLLLTSAYKAWEYYKISSIKPVYDSPYMIVYGRDSCGFTQSTIKALTKEGIKFHYMSVDDKAVRDSLHERMRSSGMDTSFYYLPVVDLNNSIRIRPKNEELVVNAKSLSL